MTDSLPPVFRGLRPTALVLDVDGVLTDNSIWLDAEGRELKRFFVPDGGGIKALLAFGVVVAWLSGRESDAVRARAAELGVEHVHLGIRDKGPAIVTLLVDLRVDAASTVYLGDDGVDLPAMAEVGVPVAVADAHPTVRQRAAAITTAVGGRGAVREVCEWILRARGEFDQWMARFDR
ncbi:MAG: HAD hydrolase family protein [Planctomycetes bacterium]|nr:HAD hydrolase family protein [Planctomycetota bacterium]